jgi:hypothetical protein
MSQAKGLANSLIGENSEALSFQISASNPRPRHSAKKRPAKTTSPEVPYCSHSGNLKEKDQ